MTQGCQELVIQDGSANADFFLYQNDFQTPIYEGTLNSGGYAQIDSVTLGLGAGEQLLGVFAMESAGETHAIVAPCDIVCCLAKKMDAYLDKTCQCEQCDKDLDDMYKIFLLLHTAQVSSALLQNIELIAAKRKYDKALELCKLSTCKCNC